jgi:predicted metal-dependent enzyme (double-stranded beta helix superfamily)
MKRQDQTTVLTRRTTLGLLAAQTIATLIPERTNAGGTPGGKVPMKFDRERFVESCIVAHRDSEPQAAVREVLVRAVHDAPNVLAVLGSPTRAGLDVLHRSPTLTIFAAHWAPRMCLPAHDHRLWALIGIYSGREDNILWRRINGRIAVTEAKVLFEGDVAQLPSDAIHSVTNPLERYTAGIHIYGGDFFATPRSQWNPESLREEPSDGTAIRAMFDRENQRTCSERPTT